MIVYAEKIVRSQLLDMEEFTAISKFDCRTGHKDNEKGV